MTELVTRAQRGDSAALGEVIRVHDPHVRSVCRCLRVSRMDVDDFVQDGLVALPTPIHRYDATRGVPLWGYARPFVKGCPVNRLGMRLGLSVHETRRYRSIRRTYHQLAAEAPVVSVEAVHAVLQTEGRGIGLRTIQAVLAISAVRRVPFGDVPFGDVSSDAVCPDDDA